MAQFDVYALRASQDLLLDVQANVLYGLSSRMVTPLVLRTPFFTPAHRLNPEFQIDGETYVMITHLMTSVPASQLGRPIANLASRHDQISGALDMLFFGF
jgi:toxin CcdB